MKETILLFQFDTEKQKKLTRSLLPLKMRVKVVSEQELHLPVGYLAGMKELLQEQNMPEGTESEGTESEGSESEGSESEGMVSKQEADGSASITPKMDAEMLVMAGLSSARIDAVLGAIRRSGIGPVPYKAILTPTNQYWDGATLLTELKREHAQMSQKAK